MDEIKAGDLAFNKDFVLKTCLVLCDFNDIRFKVDNFNKQICQLFRQLGQDKRKHKGYCGIDKYI